MNPLRLRVELTASTFIAVVAVLNVLLYHLPLFSFAAGNLDLSSFTGNLTLATLLVPLLSETIFLLTLLALLSQRLRDAYKSEHDIFSEKFPNGR